MKSKQTDGDDVSTKNVENETQLVNEPDELAEREPLRIGRFNTLTVVKFVEFGVYLDGLDWGEILLPARYAPADLEVGQMLSVFVYFDSEDRIIATTDKPKAVVGEFAYLQVIDVNDAGAFLDWGLPKDVLAPYAEQATRMRQGAYYLVYLYQDPESERITASSKIINFINTDKPDYVTDETVSLVVVSETDLGYKVIVNHQYWGMLYRDEVFRPLKIGQAINGQIKKVREDNKIDLYLKTIEKSDLSTLSLAILDKLQVNHGVLNISDKTAPEEIYKLFSVSKKNYKRALGQLYKARLISIHSNYIQRILD